MKKTLLKAKHEGQHINGIGGCHTRWAENGYCVGVRWANWLNSLGADNEQFYSLKGVTNGDVRKNWLRHTDHLTEEN